MDTLVLEEDSCIDDLLPFTATRPVVDIRVGILTLREKWERLLPKTGVITPLIAGSRNTSLPIGSRPVTSLPANILPTALLAAALRERSLSGPLGQADIDPLLRDAIVLRYPWHIFENNALALAEDFALLTAGRRSQPLPPSIHAVAADSIFVEEGARLQNCSLNASAGPIYIGRNSEIMEGAFIRGPFALCEGAVVKMGAKIYGATTIGPHCVVGGEIKNSVLFGHSNKAHDGYLGDSVIGEWCNLGAGTSNSNVKNNAGTIKVWHPGAGRYIPTGLKCGLLMGDYCRSAINTSFNSGTVTGIGCNIFGTGLTPKFIPDFNWGYPGRTKYEWDKALRDIANWKRLKNRALSDDEILTLKTIFEKN